MVSSRLGFALIAATLAASSAAMDIKAKSAVIMDAATGKVLWSKAPDTPRFPASTTKIMTALLLIEHSTLDEVITAPSDVEKVGESSMHLKPGEKVRVEDMLYALMLRSANDGCYAVAMHVSGSVPAFADLMNERARKLGCQNTNFHNPNGLNDADHVTSARDLALIAREAMKNPIFAQVVRTPRFEIRRSINQKDTRMVSRNKWLFKDASADGIKTGYTRPAGHCYVGSATRNGYRVITVLMRSPNWQQEHRQMLDWAFKNHARQTLLRPTMPVAQLPVAEGSRPSVSVEPAAAIETIVRNSTLQRAPGHFKVEPEITTTLRPPIARGSVVGQARVRDAEGFEQRVDLIAMEDVALAPAFVAPPPPNANPLMTAVGSALLVGAAIGSGRLRRRNHDRQATARRAQ